jgi:Putative  PD-(D/E)XK family member, (DUF4420)
MIAEDLQEVMDGEPGRTIGLTGHPHLPMYVTNLGDRPGLLVDVQLPEGLTVEDGQGFDVVQLAGPVRNRLLVRPTKPGAVSPAFLGLVEYVYRETGAASTRDASVSALLDAVHEFRQFFARRADRLSEVAVRGLFAELELILDLEKRGVGIEDVLRSWSGPFRGTDFRFPAGAAVEVKTVRVPAKSVKISSEHQLENSERKLCLLVRPLATVSRGDQGSIAFTEVVDQVKRLLGGSPNARTLWRAATSAIGFDETDSYYDQWAFVAEGWRAFEVEGKFPRITPGDLPEGVRSVSYAIELSKLEGFETDRDAVLESLIDGQQ